MVQNKNSLRIIGGAWRSRRIQFVDHPEIRPTPDRVRETLFNWLANKITGARCLDLFAGSGALGFEAASRGAAHVVLVDKDRSTTQMLEKQKHILEASQLEIVNSDALDYLQQIQQPFDVVFLDPPFSSDLLKKSLANLADGKALLAGGLIYIEDATHDKDLQCNQSLRCIREKVAGKVRYALLEIAK